MSTTLIYRCAARFTLTIVALLPGITGAGTVVRDGQVDPSVSITPITFAGAPKINDIARLPDGKLLVGGEFSNISTGAAAFIARLNADGSFDASFHGDPNSYVSGIHLGPNGETYINGNFTQ